MKLIDKIERIPSTEGVVLYLPLDKDYMRGALVQDQSQEQNHGTAVSTPVPSYPGFLFTAASTQHVNCGQDSSLAITTISMTAWVKLASGYSTVGSVIGKRGTGLSSAYFLEISAAKKVGINGANVVGVDGDEILPEDKWTFVGASYNGTVGKIYVNDMAAETETINAPGTVAVPVLIGAANFFSDSSFAEYFDGLIGDVRIYNRILTDGEFLGHYTIQRGKYGV